jgi:hypothetical protein
MANATAAQAYTAVRLIEATMEDTDTEGYHNIVPLQVVLDQIQTTNAGVLNDTEAMFGVLLATGGHAAVADPDIVGDTNAAAMLRGEYKANNVGGTVDLPVAATNVLFLVHTGQFVTSLSNPV